MRHFSIKELEQLSGIRAHTIRIWESRYALFAPGRTAANIRYYSVEDLQHLLNISLLYGRYRISQLVLAGREALERKSGSVREPDHRLKRVIHRMMICMFREDIDAFERALQESISLRGFAESFRRIVIPFLQKVDVLSYRSSGTDVHFVVTAIRRKIIFAIESLRTVSAESSAALLFLPKGEHYDLMLLYIQYLLKAAGMRVFYLGTNVPHENLEGVVMSKKPAVLCSYSTSGHFDEHIYACMMGEHIPESVMFVVHPFRAAGLASRCVNIQFLDLEDMGRIGAGRIPAKGPGPEE